MLSFIFIFICCHFAFLLYITPTCFHSYSFLLAAILLSYFTITSLSCYLYILFYLPPLFFITSNSLVVCCLPPSTFFLLLICLRTSCFSSYYLLGVFCFLFILNPCAIYRFRVFILFISYFLFIFYFHFLSVKDNTVELIIISCHNPLFPKNKTKLWRCGDLKRFNNLNSSWWTRQKSKIEGKRSCSLLPHFTPLSLLSTHNINSLQPTIRPMAFLLAHWQQKNKGEGMRFFLLLSHNWDPYDTEKSSFCDKNPSVLWTARSRLFLVVFNVSKERDKKKSVLIYLNSVKKDFKNS